MKQLSLKHRIALVELAVLIILGCYFFLPKSFSQAMGKGFDPDQVTAVTVQLEGARGKRGEDHTFTLSPHRPHLHGTHRPAGEPEVSPAVPEHDRPHHHPGLCDHPDL